tara:strand:+ start:15819 stop:17102 length:1284 start_codon:yes stop_codon:yes gene_type:complete
MALEFNTHLRIIDPVFDRSSRAIFEFPTNTMLLSNIRLLNVGFTSDQSDNYNPLGGARSAIKSMRLLDGAEVLDQINDFTTYNNYKGAFSTNDTNFSLVRQLNYNSMGFVQQGVVAAGAAPANQVAADTFKIKTQNPVADNVGKEAWISLRDCFGFLRSQMGVPTNIYKNLRLEVTYHSGSSLAQMVQKRADATLTVKTGVIVCCDEVADSDEKESMMKSYSGVVYNAHEFDRVRMVAVDGLADAAGSRTQKQSSNFLLNGFNNKYLRRLLLTFTPEKQASWRDGNQNKGFGNNGSLALLEGQYQVRVNGQNLLPGGGTASGNRALAMTTDAWGDYNLIPGMQFVETQNYGDYIQSGTEFPVNTQGNLAYFGLRVEEYINSLQLFIDRTGVVGNDTCSQAISVNVMGEVQKSVIVASDGSYRVLYTQ